MESMDRDIGLNGDGPSITRVSQDVSSRHSTSKSSRHNVDPGHASDGAYVSSTSHQNHHPDDDRTFFFPRDGSSQLVEDGSFHGGSMRSAQRERQRRSFQSSGSVRSNRSGRSSRSRDIVHRNRMIQPNASSSLSQRGSAPLESPGMSVMSVVFEGSHVAFCCYNEDRNEILTETCQASGYETGMIVERFIQVAQPTLVLVGTPIINNSPLLQMVTKASTILPGEENGNGNDTNNEKEVSPSTSSIPYRAMKSGSFDLQRCKTIILQKLRITTLSKERKQDRRSNERQYGQDHTRHFPSNSTEERLTAFEPSSFHYLAAVVDFDSKVLVKALGSLLSYLETSVFQLDGGIIRINRLIQAKVSDCMIIPSNVFSALHIFAEETHPLIGKKNGNSKEGFSLYSLLDRTHSMGGRKLLKNWMLKPLNNLQAINTRLDTIDLFLKPILQTTVGTVSSLLKRVGPVDSILIRMQKCTTKPKDYLVLNSSLNAMISLGNVLRNDILGTIHSTPEISTELCLKYFSNLLSEFNLQAMVSLRGRVCAVIDEEATAQRSEGVAIRYGFNDQLDNWRDQYESLRHTLQEVGRDLYEQYPQLDGLVVVFMPQIGFLVGLGQELVQHAHIQLPQDFEHIFDEDGVAYFKSTETRSLDDEIGDLDGLIKDTESMILSDLEEDILDSNAELQECFNAISTLDCHLSLTECAADLGYNRPLVIDTENGGGQELQGKNQVIYAKEARHPLLEVISEREFVTNDIRIDEQDRIVVVTGPNYSGKSCYLRQIGLLVYMAHIGSFVPASEAVVAITDQIFARFSSIESWSRPQSGYQQECTEIASIFQKATRRSLVLLDEVGKGTHPASGIAILGASLKKFSKMQCNTVCSTHFLELFSMDILKDKEEGIRSRRMAVVLPDEKEEDTVVPLFKLEDGVATSSAGLACAKHAGIENDVIERARDIIVALRKNEAIKPLPQLTGGPAFSKEEAELLLHFVSVENWETASDDDLRLLIQKVAKFSS